MCLNTSKWLSNLTDFDANNWTSICKLCTDQAWSDTKFTLIKSLGVFFCKEVSLRKREVITMGPLGSNDKDPETKLV